MKAIVVSAGNIQGICVVNDEDLAVAEQVIRNADTENLFTFEIVGVDTYKELLDMVMGENAVARAER